MVQVAQGDREGLGNQMLFWSDWGFSALMEKNLIDNAITYSTIDKNHPSARLSPLPLIYMGSSPALT